MLEDKYPQREFQTWKAVEQNKQLPIYRYVEPEDIPVLRRSLKYILLGGLLSFFFQSALQAVYFQSIAGLAGSVLLAVGYAPLRGTNRSVFTAFVLSLVQLAAYLLCTVTDVFFESAAFAAALPVAYGAVFLLGAGQYVCLCLGTGSVQALDKRLLWIVFGLYIVQFAGFFSGQIAGAVVSAVMSLAAAAVMLAVYVKFKKEE